MTIDKQKLQKLLWAEVAAWSVSAPDWPTVTQALEEFLGKQTLEEVALELLVENERLRKGLLESVVVHLPQDLSMRLPMEVRDICVYWIEKSGLRVAL